MMNRPSLMPANIYLSFIRGLLVISQAMEESPYFVVGSAAAVSYQILRTLIITAYYLHLLLPQPPT